MNILRRAILISCGVAALSAAAAVVVVALAFALYAALEPMWGAALAGAGVAGAAALLILVGGLFLVFSGAPMRSRARRGQDDIASKVLDLARDKPIVAAAAIVATGIVAASSPRLLSTALASFLATKAASKTK